MASIQQYSAMAKQVQVKRIQWTAINIKNQKKEYSFH